MAATAARNVFPKRMHPKQHNCVKVLCLASRPFIFIPFVCLVDYSVRRGRQDKSTYFIDKANGRGKEKRLTKHLHLLVHLLVEPTYFVDSEVLIIETLALILRTLYERRNK